MLNKFTAKIVKKFGTPCSIDPNIFDMPHPIFTVYADLYLRKIFICDGSNIVGTKSLNLLDILDLMAENLIEA